MLFAVRTIYAIRVGHGIHWSPSWVYTVLAKLAGENHRRGIAQFEEFEQVSRNFFAQPPKARTSVELTLNGKTMRGTIPAGPTRGIHLTSLTAKEANPARLLELIRKHWQIENGLHDRRDDAFREDRCTLRTGHAVEARVVINNGS